MENFYRDLMPKLSSRGWLHFTVMTIDGGLVSAEIAYVYNNRLYAAISARDISYFRYGVGHVHVMYLVQYAIGRGFEELDFLRGEEPYKYRWAGAARKYIQVFIGRKRAFSGMRLRLLRAFIRYCEIRHYSLREIYFILRIRARERRERKRIRIAED